MTTKDCIMVLECLATTMVGSREEMLRTNPMFDLISQEIAAIDLAQEALIEKQERENPQALTLEDLREMDGEAVLAKSGDRVFACVVQKRPGCNNNVFAHGFHDYNSVRLVHDVTFTFSAMDVECYRYPPKENNNDKK